MCDTDLEKIPQNVGETCSKLFQNITKKCFSGHTLNRLFSSNKAIRIDSKKNFFFSLIVRLKIILATRRIRIRVGRPVLQWKLILWARTWIRRMVVHTKCLELS